MRVQFIASAAGAAVMLAAIAGCSEVPRESSSPTPAPSVTPSAPVEEAYQDGGLFLDAKGMSEDVWEAVDAGWVLTYWEPTTAESDDTFDTGTVGVAAVYLTDPTSGQRYEVGHFDTNADFSSVEIAYWEPQSERALVFTATYEESVEGSGYWSWMDMRSGAMTRIEEIPGGAAFEGKNIDGNLMFRDWLEPVVMVLSPDGEMLAPFDLPYGAELGPDGSVFVDPDYGPDERPTSITTYRAVNGEEMWTFDFAGIPADAEALCDMAGWAAQDSPAVLCAVYPEDSGEPTWTEIYSINGDRADLLLSNGGYPQWAYATVASAAMVATAAYEDAEGDVEYSLFDVVNGGEASPSPLGNPMPSSEYAPSIQSASTVDVVRWSNETALFWLWHTGRNTETGTDFEVTPQWSDASAFGWHTVYAVYTVGSTGQFH